MKHALRGLLIANDPEMIAATIEGRKKISVREGHRDYAEGDSLLIGCHVESWAIMAKVTSVRHCILSEVTEQEALDDGFKSHDDLVQTLKKFYPTITLESPVTVLRWDDIKGRLVDMHNNLVVAIPFDGVYWNIVPVVRVVEGDGVLLDLQWGWTAGMSADRMANLADDCPTGHEQMTTTLDLAEELRDKLTAIIDQYKTQHEEIRKKASDEMNAKFPDLAEAFPLVEKDG